jgi:hypothetical protein
MNGVLPSLSRRSAIVFGGGAIALAVAVAGCQSPSATPAAPASFSGAERPARSRLVLSPSKISYGLRQATMTVVRIKGGAAPYTISQGDALVADITPAEERHAAWIFTVTPVAAGTSIVTVKDSHGSSASLKVSQQKCSRLSPELQLFVPAPGSGLVSKTVGAVYVGDSKQDPGRSLVTKYFARLTTANQTFLTGTNFVPAPLPSKSPPPANTVTYRAGIGVLQHNTTYYLEAATTLHPCLPPNVIAFFKTQY